MEGIDFNIDFVFNFVGATPDTPINPGSISAATADPISIALVALFLALIILTGVYFLFRLKSHKINCISKKENNSVLAGNHVVMKAVAFIAAVLLATGISFAITKAFAGNDVPTTQQNINVYISPEDGEMTFDSGILTNTETVDVSILGSQISLSEEFAKDSAFTQSSFEVDGLGGVIYKGNLEGNPYYVEDPNMHSLESGKSETINFKWSNLGQEKVYDLIGKQALTITIRVKNTKIEPPSVDPLEYNGSVQSPFKIFSDAYIVEGQTEAKDVGTYNTSATLVPGFEWDSPSPLPQTIDFEWKIEAYKVSQTSTDAYLIFSQISPGQEDPYTAVFNQQDHLVSPSFENSFGDTEIYAVYNLIKDGQAAAQMIDAGSYSLNVTNLEGPGSQNYVLQEEVISQGYTIEKAPSIISAPAYTLMESTYDPDANHFNDMPVPETFSGQISGYTPTQDLPEGFAIQDIEGEYKIECASGTQVNWINDEIVPYVLSITARDTGDQNHYSGSVEFDCYWTINRAKSNMAAPVSGLHTWSAYNATETQSKTITPPTNYIGDLTYSKSFGEDYFSVEGNQMIAAAGTPVKYEGTMFSLYFIGITATDEGDRNYLSGQVTYDMRWTIDKAQNPMVVPEPVTAGIDVETTSISYTGVESAVGDVTYSKVTDLAWVTSIENFRITFDFTKETPTDGIHELEINAYAAGDLNYNEANESFFINLDFQKLSPQLNFDEYQTITDEQTWSPNDPLTFNYKGASSTKSSGAITYELASSEPEITVDPLQPNFVTSTVFYAGTHTIQIKATIAETADYESSSKISNITFTINKVNSTISFMDQNKQVDLHKISGFQQILEFDPATVPISYGETVFNYSKNYPTTWRTYADITDASKNQITFTYSSSADKDYDVSVAYNVKVSASNPYYNFEDVSATINATLKDTICAKAVMNHSSHNKDDWSMTFYYDYEDYTATNIDQYIIEKNVDFDIFKQKAEGNIAPWQVFYFQDPYYWPTPSIAKNVLPTSIVFDSSFSNFKKLPSGEDFTSIAYWFNDMPQVKSVVGLENIANQITNANATFANLNNTEQNNPNTLDLSNFKQTKLSDVIAMFYANCWKKIIIPEGFAPDAINFGNGTIFKHFGTFSYMKTEEIEFLGNGLGSKSLVTAGMFEGSDKLKFLDVSKIDTTQITNASYMFAKLQTITDLDLTKNNFTNIKNTENMFYDCSNLKTIYNNKDITFNDISGSTSWSMFEGCSSLMGGNGFKYNKSYVDINYAKVDMNSADSEATYGYFTYKSTSAINDECTLTYEFDENTSQETKDLYANYSQTVKQGTCFTVQGASKMPRPEYIDDTKDFKEWTDGVKSYKSGEPILATGTSKTLKVTWREHQSDVAKAIAFNASEIYEETIVEKFKFVYDDKVYKKGDVIEGEGTIYEVYNITQNTNFDLENTQSGAWQIAPWQRIIEDERYPIPVFPTILPVAITIDESFSYCDTLLDPSTGDVVEFTSIAGWFFNMLPISYSNLENLGKPEILTDASFAFSDLGTYEPDNKIKNYSNINDYSQEINLSKFDQPNISKVTGMFSCGSALSIILPQNFAESAEIFGVDYKIYFGEDEVPGIGLFYGSYVLFSITVSDSLEKPGGFTVGKNVKDWCYTFAGCVSLYKIDLDKFNFTNIVSAKAMFAGCTILSDIVLPPSFLQIDSENKLTDASYMFYSCDAIQSIDMSNLNTSQVVSMKYMFSNCNCIESLYFPETFTTDNVLYMEGMFNECAALYKIFVDKNWNLYSVLSVSGDWGTNMFAGCYSLTGINGTNLSNASGRTGGRVNVYGALLAHIDVYKPAEESWPGYFSTWEDNHLYWGYSNGDTTLNISPFYLEGSAETIQDELLLGIPNDKLAPWNDHLNIITKVVIHGASGTKLNMISTQNLFKGLIKAKTIEGLNYLDMGIVKDTSAMFYQFGKDAEFDSKVNFSEFVTSDMLTNVSEMFAESNIPNLKLLNMNTNNVDNMVGMFQNSKTETLDITAFSSRSIVNSQNIVDMFKGCNNLHSILVSDQFNLSNLEPKVSVFEGCSGKLEGGQGTKWTDANTSSAFAKIDGQGGTPGYFSTYETCFWGFHNNVLYLSATMVAGKAETEDANILKGGQEYFLPWRENVLNIKHVIILGAEKINFKSCFDLFSYLYNCESVEGLENLNLINVDNMDYMFSDIGSLLSTPTQIDTSKLINTSSLTDMESMFQYANIENIDLSNLDVTNVKNMSDMFYNCLAKTIDISGFVNNNNCNYGDMFQGCSNLEIIYATNNFDLSTRPNIDMFSGCSSKLHGGMNTQWSQDHIFSDYAHIDGGEANPGYFTKK